MTATWQSICTANSLTYALQPGAAAPRIRRRNQTLDICVLVNITGATIATTDLRPAFGYGTMFSAAWAENRQVPASALGSVGVLHWAPGVYIRFWTAGNNSVVVSVPIIGKTGVDIWPTSLPGTPA